MRNFSLPFKTLRTRGRATLGATTCTKCWCSPCRRCSLADVPALTLPELLDVKGRTVTAHTCTRCTGLRQRSWPRAATTRCS